MSLLEIHRLYLHDLIRSESPRGPLQRPLKGCGVQLGTMDRRLAHDHGVAQLPVVIFDADVARPNIMEQKVVRDGLADCAFCVGNATRQTRAASWEKARFPRFTSVCAIDVWQTWPTFSCISHALMIICRGHAKKGLCKLVTISRQRCTGA